jgi:hypothetical protein
MSTSWSVSKRWVENTETSPVRRRLHAQAAGDRGECDGVAVDDGEDDLAVTAGEDRWRHHGVQYRGPIY